MIKQQKYRYVSLMSHIALTLLCTHGLMYLTNRLLSFVYTVAYFSYGNVFFVDFTFLLIDCVQFVACLFIPLKFFAYLRRNAFHEKVLPIEHPKASIDRIIAIFLLGLAANWIFAFVNISFVDSLLPMAISGENEEYILGSQLTYGYQIVIYIISTAILPAIAEEYVFRKTICHSLLPYGPKTAVVVSAVVFALMHTSAHKIGFTFLGGLFMGWLYVASKDIKVSMLFHFIHNLTSCISTIIYYKQGAEAYTSFVRGYAEKLLVVGIIALIYLIVRRKKMDEALVMITEEEGAEGKLLTFGERFTGFFSPVMIIFVIATIIQMYYYISFYLV